MNLINGVTSHSLSSQYKLEELDPISSNIIADKTKLSIIIIEKGHGLSYINDTKLSLLSPMIICINETETFTITQSANLKGKVFSFDPSLINDRFNFNNIRNFDHNFSVDDIEMALHLSIFLKRYDNYIGQVRASEIAIIQLEKLLNKLTTSSARLDVINHCVNEMIMYIERMVKTNSVLSHSIISDASHEMQDVLLYLHTHYKNKITIPQLSKLFHVNRTTLSDRFYEATGETIITYLNKQRINMATMMLRDSSLPISDIANEVGFNDTAYFAKLFKKYIRHTPSEYRQRYYCLSQSNS